MLNMKKFIQYTAIVFSCLVLLPACKDFLDINEDPNNPTEARLNQLLPSICVDVAGAMGSATGGLGNFTSLYVHHTVQRGSSQNDYAFRGDDFGVATPWDILYSRALTDIRELIALGEADESWAYVGVAQILRAYSFSVVVDLWGDAPFSQANQGATNPFPEYDLGEDIYPQLITMIDDGLANIARTSTLSPSSDDLFYNGNLNQWRKFAKTLKLKLYLHTRLVDDVSSEVNVLLTEGDLIGPGEDFEMQYGTSAAPTTRNPGYAQEYAPGAAFNYISPYFFEVMSGLNSFGAGNILEGLTDPRVPYYFYNQLPAGAQDGDAENPCSYCPSRSGTGFLSIWAFSFNIDPNEGFDQSSSQTIMGLYPIGGRYDDGQGGIANFNGAADTPQRILTYYARKYMEAELAHAGVTGGDPRALLMEAIQASFDKVNEIAGKAGAPAIQQVDITAYIDNVMTRYDAGTNDEKLEHIMTQKWIATFGFGVDAYADYRRTGYPTLHDGNTDDLNFTTRTREYPLSFPWKTNDLRINPNAPEQKLVAEFNVFWDQ